MNQTSVFQQGAMQMLMNVPFDRLAATALSAPPNLLGLQLSSNMMPFTGPVLIAAINAIQGGAGTNAPRTYLFNVMAQNNYDNPMFRKFIDDLSRFIEVTCLSTRQLPQNVINEATQIFTTYMTAQLAMGNPNMHPVIGQQVIAQMQNTIMAFDSQFRTMAMGLQGNQQGMGMGMGGGGYGGPAPGTVSMTGYGNYGNNQGGNFNINTGSLFAGSGVNTAIFGSGGVNLSSPTAERDANNAAAPPPPAITEITRPSQAGVVVETMGSTGVISLGGAPAPAPPPAQQQPASSEAPVVKQVGDSESVKWMPSEKFPFLTTFDPNKEELKFFVYSDKTIQPTTAQKADMDRNKHLATIDVTPNWVSVSQATSMALPANEGKDTANHEWNPEDVQVVAFPDNMDSTTNLRDNWVQTEAHVLTMRSNWPQKVLMGIKYSMVFDTVLASSKVIALIRNITASKTPADCAGLIKKALSDAVNSQSYRDIRAIRRIIVRLQQRLNRFVRNEMSSPVGTIDEYVEDAPQLGDYFQKRFGDRAREIFLAGHKTIVNEAAMMAEGQIDHNILKVYFEASNKPQTEDMNIINLYNNVAFGVVDMSTIELRAEIPRKGFSVMIDAGKTPLIAHLATALQDRQMMHSKCGAGIDCDRLLLRTSDGVTLELSKPAYLSTNDATLVSFVGAD
jgi:hypothetical protein